MFKCSVTVISLALFSLLLVQPLKSGPNLWASDEPVHAGLQTHSSPGTEGTMPDGVIGVSLHVGAEHVGDRAVLYIAHVLPEGPAEKVGLKQGDELTTVDGVPVTGKTYEQVALMVRGEPGTVVKLGVKREGETREVSVTRAASQSLYKGPMESHGGSTR